jgi:hypothetical protein
MHRKQQLVLDSLRRVQGCLDTRADVVGRLKDTEARKQLDAAVDAAVAKAEGQRAAENSLAGSKTTTKALVSDLKVNHMTPIAKFARANLRGVPDFNALTNVPHNLIGHSLVIVARAMATSAAPYAAALTKAQFPADCVQQLATAANALNSALDARVAAQSQRVETTGQIRQELALGREAVAMLDPIVIKMSAGQKGLLAAWRTAKRVSLTPGQAAVPTAVPVATPASALQVPSSSGTAQTAAAQEVKVA